MVISCTSIRGQQLILLSSTKGAELSVPFKGTIKLEAHQEEERENE